MFLDENEVIPFQKTPWNALCKNGILLKIPISSKPNLKTIFSIKHPTIISVHSIALKCCRNQFHWVTLFKKISKDSAEFQKKIVIFKLIEKLQNLSHALEQRLFCQNFFLSNTLTS